MPEPSWRALGSLVVTSLAIMGSPGPATISLTAAGSAYGIRRSLRYLTGVIGGTMIVLVAVATGVTATVVAVPALRVVMIVVSAVYILWLAYRVATAPLLAASAADAKTPAMAGGALLGVANPKAWIAIAAVFASVHLANAAVVDAAAKVAVLALMIIIISTAWLAAGASFAAALRDPRRARIVNAGLAFALVAAAALAVLR